MVHFLTINSVNIYNFLLGGDTVYPLLQDVLHVQYLLSSAFGQVFSLPKPELQTDPL